MARCYCRRRKVVLCVCAPCILLALLFLSIMFIVCMDMNRTAQMETLGQATGKESPHFLALGTYHNKSFAPYPLTFWQLHVDAIWNRIQLEVDRNFNPILHPNNLKKQYVKSTFHESLLWRSSSEVTDLDSTKEKFLKLPLQLQEFVRHMNRRDYQTLNQPEGVCGAGVKGEKEPPLLLLAIKTTVLNFKNRQAIRQTWGQVGWRAGTQQKHSRGEQSGGYIRRVFLLGREDPEELGVDLSKLLQMESKQYGDILQWDFKDTFFNLTLKDVLFWKWFSSFCNQTRFVFKGDDDVFVNTLKMITFLQDQLNMEQAQKTLPDFMVGDVIGAAMPSRVNKSKYFIPDSFYKGLYPVYAGGGGVIYSGLLAKRLHNISKRVHMFPIDDVYVGMCMLRLNAQPIHNPAFLTFDFPEKEEEDMCAYHKIILVHKRSPNQMVRLWSDVKKTMILCDGIPLREENKKKNKSKLFVPPQ